MALYFILPRREIIKLEGHIYRRYGIKYGISVLDADLVGMVQAVVPVAYTHLDVYKRQQLYVPASGQYDGLCCQYRPYRRYERRRIRSGYGINQ